VRSFAIIPAAGHSVRMGEPKLLLPWGSGTVIECVLAAWCASRVDRIVTVVRGDDAQLAEVCRRAGAEVAVPETPPPEMKDSVAVGLEYIQKRFDPNADDAWLLAPADMPTLSPFVIDRLLAEHAEAARATNVGARGRSAKPPSEGRDSPGGATILVATFQGKRGHPVLFPWALAREVPLLAPHEGVNALLERHLVREVACSDATILDDLDTPAKYRRQRPSA
jgi:molybdenum cofactor cytidylyltransferase